MKAYPCFLAKKLRINIALSLSLLTLAACGSNQVIVDGKGIDPQRYETDLRECKQYASEVKSGQRIAQGAGVGAVVGGLIGAAVGNSDTAARVAGVGAVKGGTTQGIQSGQEKKQVLRNCLKGRGYRVLN